MADELKEALRAVKGGKTWNFGFIKGNPQSGFIITPKKIAAVTTDLEKQAGKKAKPIKGKVYFDKDAQQLIFRVAGAVPSTLRAGLKEAATQQNASLGKYEVVPGTDEDEDAEKAATVPAAPPPPPPPPGGAAAEFKARLGALMPNLAQVLTLKTPNVAKVQTLNSAVKAAVGAQDFTKGLALLDELEPLVRHELAARAAPAASPHAPPAPQPAVAEATGKQVVFTQSRLAWDAARKKAHDEIEKLKDSIRVVYRGEDDFTQVEASLAKLDEVLRRLDERLITKLDEALNAGPEERPRLNGEARKLVQDYKAYLTSDELVQSLDNNPFVPLTVHKTLLTTVSVLEKKLA
jgi:hypothetical protein